jgi:hypothetical protein
VEIHRNHRKEKRETSGPYPNSQTLVENTPPPKLYRAVTPFSFEPHPELYPELFPSLLRQLRT